MQSALANKQEDFNFAVDEKDWAAVKLLLEELEEELAERRSHLLFRVNVWVMSVRVFKRVEDRKMVIGNPTKRDRDYHRAMLGFLKGYGELLLMELERQDKADPKNIGMTFEDFAASVQGLRYAEREWYGDMTEARREEILGNVFGKPI